VVRGPSWVEGCLLDYWTFDSDEGRSAARRLTVKDGSAAETTPSGLIGRALDTREKRLVLEGGTLSPHGPLTISFWWALNEDLPADGSFSLFQLGGKGIVSAFVRGKGEWCALREPAGVLQVYYFPGIQDVNDIYDPELSRHLDLRAGVWHHTAAVFRRGSTVEMYTDGRRVAEVATSGRGFRADDGLTTLEVGGGVHLDEVLVLDRAIDAEQVADYHRGVRRLHEYCRSSP
jgi:hypothetical protein